MEARCRLIVDQPRMPLPSRVCLKFVKRGFLLTIILIYEELP